MNSLFEYTEVIEECKGSLEGDGDNKLFSEDIKASDITRSI